jgi:pyruvate kinase
LAEGKGVVVPGMPVLTPFMGKSLEAAIEFAVDQCPDFIALSFVTRAEDVEAVKSFLSEKSSEIPIISKIERAEALQAFDRILAASDAIMVARGDLGVEIPLEKVPMAQKAMIKRCNRSGKPVITATEMLQSMVSSPRPMRARMPGRCGRTWPHCSGPSW